jgi:hypothetical protein
MPIELKKILKDGVYATQAPLAAIRADVAAIAAEGARIASARRRLRWIALGVLIAGFLLMFPTNGLGLVVGFFGGLGVLIYSFFYGSKIAAHKYRYETLGALTDILEPDASTHTPVSVELGLKERRQELRSEPMVGRKGKQTFFLDRWLKVEGRFRDGTAFRQEFDELVRKRTYKASSGKTKTKFRSRFLVITRLAYSAKRYPGAQPLAQRELPQWMRLPPRTELKGYKATEKSILAKVLLESNGELQSVSGQSFLGLYKVLKRARSFAIRERRGPQPPPGGQR